MRVPAALIASLCALPLLAAAPPAAKSPSGRECPKPAQHLAGQGSLYRGQPVTPKKLNELPPATGYMAVLRTVDGCNLPMSVVEYRSRGRR